MPVMSGVWDKNTVGRTTEVGGSDTFEHACGESVLSLKYRMIFGPGLDVGPCLDQHPRCACAAIDHGPVERGFPKRIDPQPIWGESVAEQRPEKLLVSVLRVLGDLELEVTRLDKPIGPLLVAHLAQAGLGTFSFHALDQPAAALGVPSARELSPSELAT